MRTTLPAEPIPHGQLLDEMKRMRGGDVDWRAGRCFSLVYHASDAHAAFLQQAHALFFEDNALNPMAFASLHKMETEVVQMAADLFHGGDDACGTMTSGGTESLMLAVKTARDFANKKRPELVMPETAHVAFDKAAHWLGVRVRRARVLRDGRVDVDHVRRLINAHTVLVVASAPQYPHGVIDPIAGVAAIAQRAGVLCHVDACVGGFLLPFLERAGRRIPAWDFRVPGVTSISADLHKFGYAAKGASVLVHRSLKTLQKQFFVATEFPGGVYASPSMPGTRPGGPIAAAWASLRALGVSGYVELARRAAETADKLREGVSAVDGLAIVGEPEATLFAWRSVDPKVDTYAVADRLEARGWFVDRQHKPACVHLTVTANHAQAVDDYLADLRAAVDEVRAQPRLKSRGNAAMYGMMAKVPVRFLVGRAVNDAMARLYGPEASAPSLAPEGPLGALLEKHGPRIDAVLDAVERVRARARRSVFGAEVLR